MAEAPETKPPEQTIEEVERLRKRLARDAGRRSSWSLTGWQSVDWLLALLILAFMLYVLLPHE